MINQLKKFGLLALVAIMLVASVGMFGGCRGEYIGGGVPGMDRDLEIRIRRDIFDNLYQPGGGVRDLLIRDYFGILSDFVVVKLETRFSFPGHHQVEIGGVMFWNYEVAHIFAWNDGEVLRLWQAYTEGLLSPADVQYIHRRINQ